MLSLKEYANNFFEWAKPFLTEAKPSVTSHRCCIFISSQKLSLIHINQESDTLEVLLSELLHYDSPENLATVLTNLVKRHELTDIPTYWLLAPEDYQLFLIDGLPVIKSEFQNALNWRLRNLLTYPIEEAVIDHFVLPTKKIAAEIPMVVAVVARKAQLLNISSILKDAGLNLTTIDIPELALRNLSMFFETDEKGTAFLYFHENTAILNISKQKTLYFTRRFIIPTEANSQRHDYEQLSLEVMRYLDFFQSQWRHPSPSRFFLASYDENTADLSKILSKHLLVPVEPYSLTPLLFDENKAQVLNKNFILPIGCSLREESTYAAATD